MKIVKQRCRNIPPIGGFLEKSPGMLMIILFLSKSSKSDLCFDSASCNIETEAQFADYPSNKDNN